MKGLTMRMSTTAPTLIVVVHKMKVNQRYLGEEEECEELIASVFGNSNSARASENGVQVLDGGKVQHAICTPRMIDEPTSTHHTSREKSQSHNL